MVRSEELRCNLARNVILDHDDMKYTQYKADHDVWYRPAVKPNGFEYYKYVLIFVDNILNISHDTKSTMEKIGTLYQLKPGSVGSSDR